MKVKVGYWFEDVVGTEGEGETVITLPDTNFVDQFMAFGARMRALGQENGYANLYYTNIEMVAEDA